MSSTVTTFIVAALAPTGTGWQVKLTHGQRRLVREETKMRPGLKTYEGSGRE